MRLASVHQSQEIDQKTQKTIPAQDLMESAGAQAAQVIFQSYLPEVKHGGIAVFCGPGHNGGDGLVVARHLHCMGVRHIRVLLLQSELSPLTALQLDRVRALGIEVFDVSVSPGSLNFPFRLGIDALFGIGLNRPLEDRSASLVKAMNGASYPVVAIDVPSGLHADQGRVLGVAVKAHMTITFGLARPGFYLRQGPEHVGRLKILPLSFSPEVLRNEASTHFLFTERNFRKLLPRRKASSNKSHHGRVFILAGSEGKWGAAVLAARAAYRTGAGYVTVVEPEEKSEENSNLSPQSLLGSLPEALTQSRSEFLSHIARDKTRISVAIGPGLGVKDETAEVISVLKKSGIQAVVLDADAITVSAKEKLFPFPRSWIMTPHAAELARCMGVSTEEIDSDPCGWALKAHLQLGCIILLKGYRTVVATQNRHIIIGSGNAALAKAGSGDVLTGFIASLLAQKLSPLAAACTGAYLHGLLADQWVRLGKSSLSLTASDLLLEVPYLLGVKS